MRVGDRFHHKALKLPVKSMHVGPLHCLKCSRKAGRPIYTKQYKIIDKKLNRILYRCMKCHKICKVKRLYESVSGKVIKREGRIWDKME